MRHERQPLIDEMTYLAFRRSLAAKSVKCHSATHDFCDEVCLAVGVSLPVIWVSGSQAKFQAQIILRNVGMCQEVVAKKKPLPM